MKSKCRYFIKYLQIQYINFNKVEHIIFQLFEIFYLDTLIIY